MDISYLMDLFLHLDKHLNLMLSQYHTLAYVLLFVVIFIETGLVVTPFLPGDSLLFATGAIAAAGGPVELPLVTVMLYLAAVGGDTLNYHIGHLLRDRVMRREKIPLVKMENVDKAQHFLERHGGKTITIARFIPIIRTFAPFVAGAGKMPYRAFLTYNVIGGVAWVSLFLSLGYFFGNIGYVKDHFSLIVIAIVLISVIPAVVAMLKSRRGKAKERSGR